MTRKSALYSLAVAVLMGTMAVAALADDHGMNSYGPADSSVSSRPEQGVDQPSAGEIREPMETGTVPDRTEGLNDQLQQDKDEVVGDRDRGTDSPSGY